MSTSKKEQLGSIDTVIVFAGVFLAVAGTVSSTVIYLNGWHAVYAGILFGCCVGVSVALATPTQRGHPQNQCNHHDYYLKSMEGVPYHQLGVSIDGIAWFKQKYESELLEQIKKRAHLTGLKTLRPTFTKPTLDDATGYDWYCFSHALPSLKPSADSQPNFLLAGLFCRQRAMETVSKYHGGKSLVEILRDTGIPGLVGRFVEFISSIC